MSFLPSLNFQSLLSSRIIKIGIDIKRNQLVFDWYINKFRIRNLHGMTLPMFFRIFETLVFARICIEDVLIVSKIRSDVSSIGIIPGLTNLIKILPTGGKFLRSSVCAFSYAFSVEKGTEIKDYVSSGKFMEELIICERAFSIHRIQFDKYTETLFSDAAEHFTMNSYIVNNTRLYVQTPNISMSRALASTFIFTFSPSDEPSSSDLARTVAVCGYSDIDEVSMQALVYESYLFFLTNPELPSIYPKIDKSKNTSVEAESKSKVLDNLKKESVTKVISDGFVESDITKRRFVSQFIKFIVPDLAKYMQYGSINKAKPRKTVTHTANPAVL